MQFIFRVLSINDISSVIYLIKNFKNLLNHFNLIVFDGIAFLRWMDGKFSAKLN